MAWRLARSLGTLRGEILAKWPGTTIWDIGDPAHRSRCSRHNPNSSNVVTAIDVVGNARLNVHALADRLVRNPHPEVDYIISRRRVASRRTNWAWHQYTGSNPHDTHIHIGVGTGTDCDPRAPYDSTQSWGVVQTTPVPSLPEDPMAYQLDIADYVDRCYKEADRLGDNTGKNYWALTAAEADDPKGVLNYMRVQLKLKPIN